MQLQFFPIRLCLCGGRFFVLVIYGAVSTRMARVEVEETLSMCEPASHFTQAHTDSTPLQVISGIFVSNIISFCRFSNEMGQKERRLNISKRLCVHAM